MATSATARATVRVALPPCHLDFTAATLGQNGSGRFDFFCPSLEIGHDDDNHLTVRFDAAGLAGFFSRIHG